MGRFLSFFSLLLLTWPYSLVAQAPQFSAEVSAPVVQQHAVVEIAFTLRGSSAKDFHPPSFRDFEVLAGPSTRQSTTIINGDIDRQISWSFTLLAKKQGRFTIGPASAKVGRSLISTEPIEITVGPPDEVRDLPPGQTGSAPVILSAETQGDQFYPGQQIVLQYKLYFRENVHSATTLSEDDYADFFVEPLPGDQWRSIQQKIRGVDYTVQPVKVLALYAHQSGTYTLDPLILSVGIRSGMPGMPGMPGLFSMFDTREVSVHAEPLSIRILSLPAAAPATFSGAVGHYTLEIREVPRQVSTDQAISLRVLITGEGDPKRWDPPVAVVRGSAEAYAPRILEDKPVFQQGALTYRREVEYQILPTAAGQLKIALPFTYFDPGDKVYKTLGSDTVVVDVKQGQGIANPASADAGATAGPAKASRDRWHSLPVRLLLALLLLFMGAAGWWYWRSKAGKTRPRASTTSPAALVALRALANIGRQPGAEIAAEATAVALQYLTDRYRIAPADLNGRGLEDALKAAGTDPSLQQDILRFFERCEWLRYGGLALREDADDFLEDAKALIRRVDKSIIGTV